MSTSIQWTDITDNIFRVKGGGWWCRKISPGCANCYAAKLNQNTFYGGNKLKYIGDAPEMELQRDIIKGWARMTKPKRHFVASMTDIFGEWVKPTEAYEFLDGMLAAPKQTFQMLTKRPGVAYNLIEGWLLLNRLVQLPANMWIGTSVENQEMADRRIPELLNIPAKVRFLSVEPMLEAIEFYHGSGNGMGLCWDWAGRPTHIPHCDYTAVGKTPPNGPAIHWAIFGGESGPNARPCDVEWIRDGVRQCKAAGVAAFVKQLGSRPWMLQDEGGAKSRGMELTTITLKDPKGGDISEWPTDLKVREFPNQPTQRR